MKYQKFKVLKRSFRDGWAWSVAWEIPEKNDKRNQSIWHWCEVNEIDTIIEEIIDKEAAAISTSGKDRKRLKTKRRLQNKLEKRPWNVGGKVVKEVGQMES